MVYNYWYWPCDVINGLSKHRRSRSAGSGSAPGQVALLSCCSFFFFFPSILSLVGERFSFGQWRMVVLTVVANLDVRFINFFLSLATIVVVVV